MPKYGGGRRRGGMLWFEGRTEEEGKNGRGERVRERERR